MEVLYLNLVQPYLNSTSIAQEVGKPFYMFKTNTASCGGFAGISGAYGAALWGIDYGMQLAYGNFTLGMFHTGGQNSFYNVSVFFKIRVIFFLILFPPSFAAVYR